MRALGSSGTKLPASGGSVPRPAAPPRARRCAHRGQEGPRPSSATTGSSAGIAWSGWGPTGGGPERPKRWVAWTSPSSVQTKPAPRRSNPGRSTFTRWPSERIRPTWTADGGTGVPRKMGGRLRRLTGRRSLGGRAEGPRRAVVATPGQPGGCDQGDGDREPARWVACIPVSQCTGFASRRGGCPRAGAGGAGRPRSRHGRRGAIERRTRSTSRAGAAATSARSRGPHVIRWMTMSDG